MQGPYNKWMKNNQFPHKATSLNWHFDFNPKSLTTKETHRNSDPKARIPENQIRNWRIEHMIFEETSVTDKKISGVKFVLSGLF